MTEGKLSVCFEPEKYLIPPLVDSGYICRRALSSIGSAFYNSSQISNGVQFIATDTPATMTEGIAALKGNAVGINKNFTSSGAICNYRLVHPTSPKYKECSSI